MGEQDWKALARAVKTRREAIRLPQDLVDHGGPGAMTIRKIEQAETTSIRNKTKSQLEQALGWPQGYVDRLLDGTAEPEPTVAIRTGKNTVDMHAVGSLSVGDAGVQVKSPPKARYRDVTPDDVREANDYMVVDAVVPDVGGPDRILASAEIEVRDGSMVVMGVNDVVRVAPIFTLATSLAARLANAASLAPAERQWLVATLAVVQESALTRFASPGENQPGDTGAGDSQPGDAGAGD